MTTIIINPTVKNEIVKSLGSNSMSDFVIAIYEGVYNMAYAEGKSLEEGHKMAMKAIEMMSNVIK